MYKIVELQPEEIDFVQKIFVDAMHPEIMDIQAGWIDAFQAPFRMRNQLRRLVPIPTDIEEQIAILIHNSEENLHAQIEQMAIPILDDLVCGKSGFFAEDGIRIDFLQFVCTQYTRTSVMRDRLIRSVERTRPNLGYPMTIDITRVLPLIRHIVATALAYGLYTRGENLKLQFLETDRELITGDQPVINPFAVDLPEGEAPMKLELYYPVCPARAVLLTEYSDGSPTRRLSKDEVDAFNRAISVSSEGCIYGETFEVVSQYLWEI
jgi:hypothetical protein